MNIKTLLLIFASVCALALAGCTPGAVTGDTGKVLVVGCDSNFMPFEFKEDGEFKGFDIDLWKAIADELGRDYRFQGMDFNGLIPALQTGAIDAALAGMTITSQRAKVVDFAYPYYDAGLLLMVRAGNADIHGVQDLGDKVVATKLGTTSADFVRAADVGEVRLFPNIDGAYMELRAGGADAVLFDSPAILYYIRTEGGDAVKTVGPLYQGQSYGIAFPKGSPLREEVSIVLLQFMEDGTYDAIYQKWFGAAPGASIEDGSS